MGTLHERAGAVFLAALSRPAAERDAFLVEACRGDEALLQEVGSLLFFHDGDAAAEADPFAGRKDYAAGDLFAGRYRMIARVGRGGMGDVWRADDLTLQAPVALKLMDAASASDRTRILQEARLARRVTHPAVCRVFDVGEADGAVFLSMELVQGEDLRQLGRQSEAANEFRSIVDHRGEAPDSPLYALAHLGLARALASAGDRAGARQAYLTFFTIWKDADSDLEPVQEARLELARLPQ